MPNPSIRLIGLGALACLLTGVAACGDADDDGAQSTTSSIVASSTSVDPQQSQDLPGENQTESSSAPSSRRSGQSEDRVAQATLRTALSAQNLFYVNFRTYANPAVTTELDTLRSFEPSLQYLTGASPAVTLTRPGESEVWVSLSGSTLTMAARVTESECFYLRNDPDRASTVHGQSWGTSDCTTAPTTWTAQPPTSS